jgi:hypothetical protein
MVAEGLLQNFREENIWEDSTWKKNIIKVEFKN